MERVSVMFCSQQPGVGSAAWDSSVLETAVFNYCRCRAGTVPKKRGMSRNYGFSLGKFEFFLDGPDSFNVLIWYVEKKKGKQAKETQKDKSNLQVISLCSRGILYQKGKIVLPCIWSSEFTNSDQHSYDSLLPGLSLSQNIADVQEEMPATLRTEGYGREVREKERAV